MIGAFPMNTSALRCAVAALALAVLPGSALAQAQPSASHLAIAREVVVSSGMVRSFDTITEPMLAQLQQMNVTRPEIKKDLDQVVESLKPEMELQKQQMVAAAARVYTRVMSEAELKELAAFFKSPIGVKYVQTQPKVLDDIVKEMATWSQTVSEYVIIRARAEMAKRGHQLQ
jgi:hypothetical protein